MPLILTETRILLIWQCLKNIVQGLGVTMSVLGISHGTYEPFHNQKIFWENCGEDDIKFPKEHNGRMDPLLK